MYSSWAAGMSFSTRCLIFSHHITTVRVKVWHIKVTIHCLADAGNMMDCACLAGIVALKHFRRPDVEVIGDEVIIVRHIPAFRHCRIINAETFAYTA